MSIKLEDIEQGDLVDYKVGLSTRQIERTKDDTFLIHDTSSGWMIAEATEVELQAIIDGEKSLFDLNWE